MSDYGGVDEVYDDEEGGDWIYVEDYYDEADQLAEHTCPSPAYYDEGNYGDHTDMFEYFADLEYLSDGGYFDSKDPDALRVRKRKAVVPPVKDKNKRRKTTAVETGDLRPVVWMSNAERQSLLSRSGPVVNAAGIKAVGLLKDWKEKFEDQSGLAEFPKEDFELKAGDGDGEYEDMDEDEDADEEGEEITGDGFDLSDMAKVAEMLSVGGNMEALQSIMEAQGMDPEAVQEVLKDLIEGKDRTIEEDGEDVDVDEEHEDEARNTIASVMRRTTQQQLGSLRGGSTSGVGPSGTPQTPSLQPNGHSAHAHGAKRKGREDDVDGPEGDEEAVGQNGRKKRQALASSRAGEQSLPQSFGGRRGEKEGKRMTSPRRTRNGTVRN